MVPATPAVRKLAVEEKHIDLFLENIG
jgi:hypothetical protein